MRKRLNLCFVKNLSVNSCFVFLSYEVCLFVCLRDSEKSVLCGGGWLARDQFDQLLGPIVGKSAGVIPSIYILRVHKQLCPLFLGGGEGEVLRALHFNFVQ